MTNTCDDCPDDFVIDGGQLQAWTVAVTVLQSTSQAPNDFCPNQLWIRVINTNPNGLDFEVGSALETDLSAVLCPASSVNESIFEQGSLVASHSDAGHVCSGTGPINTCSRGCTYNLADGTVAASSIPGNIFRVGASGSANVGVTVRTVAPPPK